MSTRITHEQAAMVAKALCDLAASGTDETRIKQSAEALLDALESINRRLGRRSGTCEKEPATGHTGR